MKKSLLLHKIFIVFFLFLSIQQQSLFAQCNNADFENGNLNGWTGTYGDGTCVGAVVLGLCVGCYTPDPYQHNSINQGPANQASNGPAGFNHFVMSSGYDPIVGGTALPVVYTPGSYSMRLGDAHADDAGHGGGESISYSFNVNASNCNFTYHYAVVLNDGGHNSGEQPYFKIRMFDGSNNLIDCATYDVDATTAPSIGGFVNLGGTYYKTWTSVFIPLNNYIGQNVRIQFTTRDCAPTGCDGSHWAYAYIDADCNPLQIVSSSPTICGGQNITLNAPAGAATYSWSGPGVVPPGNTQQVTVNLAGHYTVNMTTFGTVPCNFSLDTIIPGSPGNPVANFSATTVCVGNPTQFTDNSTPVGGVSGWGWDFDNNGTPDATTQSPTHTFPTAGTYPVRLVASWPPCLDDTTITVTVSAAPTSPFTATSPLCVGTNSTITYTGNAPSNATYTWNFDGGTVTSGSGQGPYQVNWATGGTKYITLTVAIGSCTSAITTVQVVVNPFPGTSVSPNISICIGGNTVLTATGGATYTWTPPTGLSATTGATVTANPITTTTYTVTGVNANCTSPANVTVSVNPVPTSLFTATTPVCAGQTSTITYTGNATAGGTYNWNFNGGTIVSGSGQGPYTVNWATGGTKSITLTVDESGCSSTLTTVNVVVNPAPTSTFTTISPICTGTNSTITYTGTGTGAANYTWGFDGGTIVSGAGQGPYDISWSTTGTKNITITVTENGCSSNGTGTVVVAPVPTSAFTVISPVCAGVNSAIIYTGNAPSNATYTWNFDGGTVTSGTGQGPYQVNWNTGGIKNVTLTVSIGACVSGLTTLPVTVNPSPLVTVSPDVAVCNGVSTTLTAGGAATYSWSPVNGLTPATGASVNATPALTTTYTVTGTSAGCDGTASVTVNVTPVPVPTINALPGQCLTGNSFAFQAGGSFIPAATFAWDFSATGTPPTSASQNQSVVYSASGTYPITLTITQNTCLGTATSSVDVYAMPLVNFAADTLFGCENLPVCFTDNSVSTSTLTYLWNFGDGITSALQNPCHTYAAPGIYTVALAVLSADGCADAATVTDMITVYADPTAAFSLSSTVIQLPETTIDIQNQSQNALTYLWMFGDSGTSTAANPSATSFTTPGSYPITLYAYNQLGCVDSVQHPVTVYQQELIFIPNIFSPNGDGNNDYFEVFGKKDGWKQFEVKVFDRWGEKVYESTDMNFKWDGTFQGKDKKLMPGVFVYTLYVVYTNNHTDKLYKGSVTLLR